MTKLKIYHRYSLPNRHNQTANIESLNRVLVRFFFAYMNKKELETGKRYNEWTDIVDLVREELNKVRRIDPPDAKDSKPEPPLFNEETPKYSVGQPVYYKLMKSKDALGHDQNTNQFREGDIRWSQDSRIIEHIFVMRDLPRYRYQLKGLPQVSWYEEELKPSKVSQTTYVIRAIIDKKTMKGEIYYKIWWQGYKKKDATWESKKNLIEDGAKNVIDIYEDLKKRFP
ncbi:MAG: hypothetical protein EOO99_12185 [Pedobacter sp.]|nr:MAG: hypothetical protein EOO99_12185 [Pedobacter sp.]